MGRPAEEKEGEKKQLSMIKRGGVSRIEKRGGEGVSRGVDPLVQAKGLLFLSGFRGGGVAPLA